MDMSQVIPMTDDTTVEEVVEQPTSELAGEAAPQVQEVSEGIVEPYTPTKFEDYVTGYMNYKGYSPEAMEGKTNKEVAEITEGLEQESMDYLAGANILYGKDFEDPLDSGIQTTQEFEFPYTSDNYSGAQKIEQDFLNEKKSKARANMRGNVEKLMYANTYIPNLSDEHQQFISTELEGDRPFGDIVKELQRNVGVEADGLLGPDTVKALKKPNMTKKSFRDYTKEDKVFGKKELKKHTLYGDKAISKVEEIEGPLSAEEKVVVREEAYVDGNYLDTKGIITSGVGQTGAYRSKSFKESFKIHKEKLEKIIPKYSEMPEGLRGTLMSAMYRGDVVSGYNWVDLINEGEYSMAAEELLDNDDYRESAGGGVAKRFDRIYQEIMKQSLKVGE